MTFDAGSKPRAASAPDTQAQPPGADVLVVVVNYCTAALTIDCLRSLKGERTAYPSTLVIVADNASPDGSGAAIAAAIEENGWSEWARLLPLPRNGGFAYGNNAAIRDHWSRGSQARYVWLLNSDAFARPGALGALVTFMDANANVGIAGSCLEDPDGTQQCSAFRFHTVASELESSLSIGPISRMLRRYIVAPPPERRSMPCEWVSGASMIIRTELFEQVGLMDEEYFLCYEETDFCRRSRDRGWSCWFVPESRVVHLIGRSTGVTWMANRTRRRPLYWFQSRRRYFEKNLGRARAIAADAALASGILVNHMLSFTRIRKAALPERVLTDLLSNSAVWPARQRDGNDR